jgi:hypothetical protein
MGTKAVLLFAAIDLLLRAVLKGRSERRTNVNRTQYGHKTAALQDFNPVYVRFGSIATDRHAGAARAMSALPPIATGLMRHSEMSRCANSGHMQCSK